MNKSLGATPIHGWLALVKKDGSLSPRFPLVEHRYVFGRYETACSMFLGVYDVCWRARWMRARSHVKDRACMPLIERRCVFGR